MHLLMLTLAAAAGAAEFEAPVLLTQGDATFEKTIYPTPVLQDLDDDGVRELVVGDLMGYLNVCKPGATDVAWAAQEPVKVDGKPLKLNNW